MKGDVLHAIGLWFAPPVVGLSVGMACKAHC